MKALPTPQISDSELADVEAALRDIPDFSNRIINAVARAVDEVVDPVRSARWRIRELDQPEKTVIGIRVENVLRMDLELPRAVRLDFVIAGTNVDVKFTIKSNWAIPPEALDQICLLTTFQESNHSVAAGLLRTTDALLNPGENRDGKRGVSAVGKQQIRWLVTPTPARSSIIGYMASLPPDVRSLITDPSVSAQTRLNRLFTLIKHRPIPESLVEAVAQHKDWTRRMRPDSRNPRAPGVLMGFDVLRQSSAPDRAKLKSLGLPALEPGFCISIDD